jgi:hypothetical protein
MNTAEDSAPTGADKKVPNVVEHDFDDVSIPPAPDNVPTASPVFSAGAIAANKERQEREEEENAPFHAFADSTRKLRVATNKKANEKKRPGIKDNTLVEDNKAYFLEIFDAARKEKNHALRMARREFTASKAVHPGFNKSVRDEAARILAKADKAELERNEKTDNHDESTGFATDGDT